MKTFFCLCVAVSTCLVVVSATNDAPVVSTEGGKISGVNEKDINGRTFFSYYGIPYAMPPVGDLRFKDPIPAEGWEGVRDGSQRAPVCPQIRFGLFLAGMKLPPEKLDGNEDCLYLNVFTPKNESPDKEGYPVMVFIHGGGFIAGGADEYNPHVLLSKDVILVVIQYRLGFLGFLSTDDSVISGNFGLKDQTLSLEWVQKNIKHFGGDPNRVTIFGESAGGASVHYQMLTPKANGLFSGAIMQSGNALAPWAAISYHARIAKELGDILGCSLNEGSKTYLECMQSLSAKTINAALQELPLWSFFPLITVPRIDGDYIPAHPARLMKEGRYNKVNLMTGITSDEGAIISLNMLARKELIVSLQDNFSFSGPASLQLASSGSDPVHLAKKIYKYYVGGTDVGPEHVDGLTKMVSDRHFSVPHDLVSQLHSQHPDVATFRYELSYQGQFSVGDYFPVEVSTKYVTHGDELYYLYRGGPLLLPFDPPSDNPRDLQTEGDLRMRNNILTLWTNFAATGRPTVDESLGFTWSATNSNDLQHLALSQEPTMVGDTRQEVRTFLVSLPDDINRHLQEAGILTGSSRTKQDEL